ncbi:PepSY-associated TM helix domain-containing protein [Stackebrandtia nassauensis]|uniref:Propeptide PepSY amd peptidase M4 n=1 Tax=Stackebrandtia nassauensis (strain DSM 44728 / CIP 108903 / NRRL B-16338 / NBRC 102104 / LLR-40K-21) TaxID=446470 RepID=D3PUK6_STANL|nr:PepSY domain-containing protein [Stackebrandtia nassauensis]ADD43019.1 Propeptide PepSY amd peptidase M4 [Stackebrandtia nassauensis DSM 44728]
MSIPASPSPAAPTAPADAPVSPPPSRRAARRSIVPLLTRLHFYAGVLVAPFLAIAALSGLAFVFSPQLDDVVYADELYVDDIGETTQPLADQVAAAREAHPDGDLATVIPPVEPDETTKVVFSLPKLGEKQHTVYVDPYDNKVKGTLTTWFGETPLMTWLDDLHRNLHLGALGRHYSELAASWLWVIVLAGVFLWIRRQWTGRRKLRRTVLPDTNAGKGVRRTRSWHAATGIWLAVGLLALSATGLTWSRYAGGNFDIVQEQLSAQRPVLDTTLPGTDTGGEESGGGHHGSHTGNSGDAAYDPSNVDNVVEVARKAGLTGKIEVTPPTEAGTAWTVAQDDATWPVGYDQIAVDADTATVVSRNDFADWPLLAQLSKLGVAFHMGFLFGLINQILLAALAIGLLCVTVWGYRMWWQRRPTRTDRTAPVGAPPTRGTWRQVHPGAFAVGIGVVVFTCWAMPVLGVSLIAFLLFDAIAGLVRRSTVDAPRHTGDIV